TWPEHAHSLVHLFISDAVVVCDPASRSFPQFLQDLGGRAVRKKPALIQPTRKVAENVAVLAGIARRGDHLPNVHDATFGGAAPPLLFFLQATGQDNVGKLSRLG